MAGPTLRRLPSAGRSSDGAKMGWMEWNELMSPLPLAFAAEGTENTHQLHSVDNREEPVLRLAVHLRGRMHRRGGVQFPSICSPSSQSCQQPQTRRVQTVKSSRGCARARARHSRIYEWRLGSAGTADLNGVHQSANRPRAERGHDNSFSLPPYWHAPSRSGWHMDAGTIQGIPVFLSLCLSPRLIW